MQQPTPAPDATPTPAGDTAHFQDVLRDLVDMASDIARHFHYEITAGFADAPEKAAAFDRAARTVRRSILLAARLDAPPKPSPAQGEPARTHLVRDVGHAIASHAAANDAETLRAEVRERLDTPDPDDLDTRPDLGDVLGTRPVQDIIDDMIQDLGIDDLARQRLGRRRTPAGTQAIEALAAETAAVDPAATEPAALPDPRPATRQRRAGKPKTSKPKTANAKTGKAKTTKIARDDHARRR